MGWSAGLLRVARTHEEECMTREKQLRRIESDTWYYSIEIELGLVTPGCLSRQILSTDAQTPEALDNLAGLSVPDIWAWKGSTCSRRPPGHARALTRAAAVTHHWRPISSVRPGSGRSNSGRHD
jgi:hypothetical protein